MTVRELIQAILLTAEKLDNEVYITKAKDDIESYDFEIKKIYDYGSGLFIDLEGGED